MAATSKSNEQPKVLIPQLKINNSEESQTQSTNTKWKFLQPEYLKELVLENPYPLMNLMTSFWQEAEKLVEMTLSKKDKESKIISIFVKANDQIINLKLNDILWVEAYGDYVNFFTEKTRYLVHSTMKGIETKLPSEQFARVHRSFIIRQDKIDLIEESLIQIGKKLIPIGESYRNDLMSRLNII